MMRDDPSLGNVEYDETIVLDDNDAEAVISNHLVLFRSLPQLQAQNVRLIKTARGLARQLEAKELEIEARIRGEESEALAEASDAVRDMEAELQRQKTLVAVHIKERDMYRSMLARQGADVELSNGHAHIPTPSLESTTSDANAAQVLQEQQAFFESFKTEMGIDTQRLRHDLVSAQRERDQNIVALSKANAQIEYLQGTNLFGS
jgi:nucleoprotein TPR